MVLPFDINVTPVYQIIYGAQFYIGIISFIGWHGTDMTYVAMMIMMIRQFTLIRIILKNMDKYANAIYDHRQFAAIGLESNDDSVTLEHVYYRILSQCIHHYARLINIRDTIAAALGPMLLAQMFMSSMVMCLALFITSSADTQRMDKMLINIVFFILTTVQIFLYSWYGQEMTNEAAEIGKDAYQVNWKDRAKPFTDALRMLINQAAKPLYLNALGFVNLTLPTFQAIFRTAMSYFTLLRSFSEEE